MYPPRFIGGAELIAHYQAKELQKLGWKVVVFTGDTQAQQNRHDMIHEVFDGLDVYRVYLTHEDYHYEFVNFSHSIVEQHFQNLLERYNPNIVHFHNIIGLSVRIIHLAKETGAKTVLTVHDHWGFCFKNTLMKNEGVACMDFSACHECLPSIEDGSGRHIPMRLRQNFFSLAMEKIDAFISPSAYLAKTYITAGFPQDRFHIVWNGVDTKRFQQLQKKSDSPYLRLSFLGYFGKHKGIQSVLEALPLVKDRTRVRVNLVGDGDQYNAYHDCLVANGCLENVKFWGKLANSDVEKVYAETDVLILPSIWKENQPVSITEAMAAGIPVIASRMGGVVELVEDGVNGFLFEAGNIEELVAIIDRCLVNHSLIKQLGDNAARRMQQHDFSVQVNKLVSIYQALSVSMDILPCKNLVICIGKQFSKIAFDAISNFDVRDNPLGIRFIHEDWCDDSQWMSACLLIVVDTDVSVDSLKNERYFNMPLLVPTASVELTNYVDALDNGFIYSNVTDIFNYLNLLISKLKL